MERLTWDDIEQLADANWHRRDAQGTMLDKVRAQFHAYNLEYADAQRALDAERERVKELEEWQRVVVGTGTDQEAVVRMAATEYTKTAVQCWKDENAKLTAKLATLQAQLRQVEGDRQTLRQLVAALPVVDVQEVSVWLSPDESGWLVSKRPAFPAGLYWAKFRTQAEADSFRALLAYRATLAAQDAGNVCTNHFSDGSKIFPSRHCECKPHPTEDAR